MSIHPKSFSSIGAELVSESQSRPGNKLPKSTELFPYLLIASRTMSMREISDWLKKKHDVALSPAAISRALAHPNLHLERLAGFISARARFLALMVNSTPRDLLHWPDDGPSELEILILTRASPTCEDDLNVLAEAEELKEMWQSIPHEVRLLIEPRLAFETDHEPNDDPYAQFEPEDDED